MRYFSTLIFLLLFLPLVTEAQTRVIRRGIVPCPVIGDIETGKFTKSPRKYVCFRTSRDAKRYAFSKLQIGGEATPSPGTIVPTPRPTATPTPPIAPTPLPSSQSFSIKGKGSGTSEAFLVTTLPATVSYSAAGAPSDRISIFLRDASTGYFLQQLGYGSGVKTNSATISKKGNVYLDIQATDGMSWAITVSYR